MRYSRLLSLTVVGIFLMAASAISMAGDWSGTWGPSVSGESDTSMDSGSQAMAPDQGSYESRETLEAGALPPGDHSLNSGSEPRIDEDAPSVDAGGVRFREGIDTGP